MADRLNSFEEIACLHIYGQFAPHDQATIRGNRAGLRALRDALTTALEQRRITSAEVMVNDGEGYRVSVEHVNLTSLCGRGPYIEELARDLMGQEREWLRRWAERRPCNETHMDPEKPVLEYILEAMNCCRGAGLWRKNQVASPRRAKDPAPETAHC